MKYLLLIATLFIVSHLDARVIVVSPSGNIKTVSEAVNKAVDGDTVLIRKAVYSVNNIVITKKITLIGDDFPTLDGAGKFQILSITGKGVVVRNIHFANSGYSSVSDISAVKIVSANNITIENNRFTHTYFGIHISNSSHFIVKGNNVQGVTQSEQTTGNGIHLWKCSNALIEGNYLSGNRDGIYFEFVTNSRIIRNTSERNIRYGLHFMFSNDDVYSFNSFKENGAGVAVMFSRNVMMNNNYFGNNWGPSSYGILLKEISDGKILHNTFLRNTVGIYMEGSNRLEIAYNLFSDNGWASKVQASCSDNNYHHNNFKSNTFDIATNGSLVLNNFSDNYWDKYEGYDLNKDGIGDIPYHPVSMYSMLVEQNPNNLFLLRSFIVGLLDKVEKAIPTLTPQDLKDNKPLMRSVKL
jgi:nitrous oxidase accessory protein